MFGAQQMASSAEIQSRSERPDSPATGQWLAFDQARSRGRGCGTQEDSARGGSAGYIRSERHRAGIVEFDVKVLEIAEHAAACSGRAVARKRHACLRAASRPEKNAFRRTASDKPRHINHLSGIVHLEVQRNDADCASTRPGVSPRNDFDWRRRYAPGEDRWRLSQTQLADGVKCRLTTFVQRDVRIADVREHAADRRDISHASDRLHAAAYRAYKNPIAARIPCAAGDVGEKRHLPLTVHLRWWRLDRTEGNKCSPAYSRRRIARCRHLLYTNAWLVGKDDAGRIDRRSDHAVCRKRHLFVVIDQTEVGQHAIKRSAYAGGGIPFADNASGLAARFNGLGKRDRSPAGFESAEHKSVVARSGDECANDRIGACGHRVICVDNGNRPAARCPAKRACRIRSEYVRLERHLGNAVDLRGNEQAGQAVCSADRRSFTLQRDLDLQSPSLGLGKPEYTPVEMAR